MAKLNDRALHNLVDDMLDDVYGQVEVAGYSYSTSYALKEIDITAYNETFNNYIDSLCADEVLYEDDNGDYHDAPPIDDEEEEEEEKGDNADAE